MDRNFSFAIAQLIQRARVFPPEAMRDLFKSIDSIEKKYDLIEPLTEEERLAIDEGLKSLDRGEGIPAEEVFKEFGLEHIDGDAMGKDDFTDVVSRVHKLSGEEQGDVADVIYALLNQYRWDEFFPKEN